MSDTNEDIMNRPTQKQMLEWLGIRYTESAVGGYVYIPLQKIERATAGWVEQNS